MMKKTVKRLAVCLLAAFLLLNTALPVFAAQLSEAEKEALLESTESYVEMVMSMDDADLEQVALYGDFYAVSAQAVRDSREELGAFNGLKEGDDISQDGSTVTILINVDCENYDAQIEITYDADEGAPKNFVINPDYPLSVNMANAGRNTVIGLVIVFVVLIFLSFVISLFRYIGPRSGKKKKETAAEEEKPVLPVREEQPAAAQAVPAAAAPDDGELIAVIAAAIAAASAESGLDGSQYIVRSIRKVGSGKRWKRS